MRSVGSSTVSNDTNPTAIDHIAAPYEASHEFGATVKLQSPLNVRNSIIIAVIILSQPNLFYIHKQMLSMPRFFQKDEKCNSFHLRCQIIEV